MNAANKQFRRPRLPLYMKKRRNWQPVALALIMVMLIASGVLYYTASRHHTSSSILETGRQYTVYQCPYGERKTITLADSTTVLLNSRSSLYVPADYPKSGRNVILDGEAFFRVHNMGNEAFVLTTDKLKTVSAEGTFRMRSLEKQSGATFYLLSGAALVTKSYHSTTDNQPENLLGGEMILANKDIDLMEKETFPLAEQQDCLEGKLVFNNTPVHTVFKKIEDWFGVEMVVQGRDTPPQGISGVFHSDSLQDMLKALGDSVDFSYRITREKVVIRF
ncbi:ferric-dicitrate binding protein FerR, regulates iron transport through sigma-19 [Chitinophaga niabensis]|uniref:Ferric-dicitrate binding protein FerR, regulates iron transport through sigma-19 n=2 Tax=Chitinophaga niabensis TaxID=536979 RepID=A0A1N6D199_9BACT|nr:ferric-dicitrate binding protein FerR, regulates iron transport through sigma-19 [Chitinophaga niabensis]